MVESVLRWMFGLCEFLAVIFMGACKPVKYPTTVREVTTIANNMVAFDFR